MKCLYGFLAEEAVDFALLKAALEQSGLAFTLVEKADNEGRVLADERLGDYLALHLYEIHQSLGVKISFVRGHVEDGLFSRALHEALGYFPNQCLFLSDLLYKELSFGDYSSLPLLSAEFKGIDPEVLSTAGAFLRMGLSESMAAKSLGIHRNTFNYRLGKFIEATSLDIRDYHNALLLELFFQMAAPK